MLLAATTTTTTTTMTTKIKTVTTTRRTMATFLLTASVTTKRMLTSIRKRVAAKSGKMHSTARLWSTETAREAVVRRAGNAALAAEFLLLLLGGRLHARRP